MILKKGEFDQVAWSQILFYSHRITEVGVSYECKHGRNIDGKW